MGREKANERKRKYNVIISNVLNILQMSVKEKMFLDTKENIENKAYMDQCEGDSYLSHTLMMTTKNEELGSIYGCLDKCC